LNDIAFNPEPEATVVAHRAAHNNRRFRLRAKRYGRLHKSGAYSIGDPAKRRDFGYTFKRRN
jgi:hypothetical protein